MPFTGFHLVVHGCSPGRDTFQQKRRGAHYYSILELILGFGGYIGLLLDYFVVILGFYWDTGKENGNYYIIMGQSLTVMVL